MNKKHLFHPFTTTAFKAAMLLIALLTSNVQAFAQNERVMFYVAEPQYGGQKTLDAVLGALSLLNGNLGKEDKSLIPQMSHAITAAPTGVYRLNVRDEDIPARAENSYVLESTLYNLMSWTGKSSGASVDVSLRLIDLSNNQTVHTATFSPRETWTTITTAEGAAQLAARVTNECADFLWNVVPITGTIVQKGVEQNNGKVKDKQCYIDMASNCGAYKGMKLGIYQGEVTKANQVGTLRIMDFEGDDLSLCTITKGNSKISKLLNSGEQLIVSSRINFNYK